MAEAAVSFKPADEVSLHWLALNLTPGLGPTKGRKLVEHFGGVAHIFKATLTELEATGIQTISAQSLGTGRSMELAYQELGRAATAGIKVVCFDDPAYPQQLKQIYDPPLVLYLRGNAEADRGAVLHLCDPAYPRFSALRSFFRRVQASWAWGSFFS